ncbi:MAG: hypothetical protein ACXWV8_06295 [Chitinophagaceae bacterium]
MIARAEKDEMVVEKMRVRMSLMTMIYWQCINGLLMRTAATATMKQKSNRFNLLVIRMTST